MLNKVNPHTSSRELAVDYFKKSHARGFRWSSALRRYGPWRYLSVRWWKWGAVGGHAEGMRIRRRGLDLRDYVDVGSEGAGELCDQNIIDVLKSMESYLMAKMGTIEHNRSWTSRKKLATLEKNGSEREGGQSTEKQLEWTGIQTQCPRPTRSGKPLQAFQPFGIYIWVALGWTSEERQEE